MAAAALEHHGEGAKDNDDADSATPHESVSAEPTTGRARDTLHRHVISREPPRLTRHGTHDERFESAVSPALRRARGLGARERDGRGAPAEAAAAKRVRAHS